jgi:predicted TIM-barrel fold metal-dependent hydrolase
MWIPKYLKDRRRGLESPIPTQAVSNEEFFPPAQTEDQRRVEYLMNEMAEKKAKKLGMDRRHFLRTSCGMATAFVAMNQVFGHFFEVAEAETWETAAYDERWPKNQFIMDVQTHHVRDGIAIGFRGFEFLKDLGVKLTNDPDSYSFKTFVKEIFLDSDTTMCVISGVPSKEDRGILPSSLMARSRDWINEVAGSERALCQSNCAPNHYPSKEQLFERMEYEAKTFKPASWKLYPHTTPPGSTGQPWWLDDEKIAYPFYEKARALGLKVISVHKGFPTTGQHHQYSHPRDVKKAALDNPDLTFVIYHSAFKADLPPGGRLSVPIAEDGSFEWTAEFVRDRKQNPKMTNVYAEIGSSFGLAASMQPALAAHLLGQLLGSFGADHVIWGTDSLWWGSPQWQIEAFRRFQIPEDLRKKFGYKQITDKDKEMILGLNAARVYKVDLKAKRKAIPSDYMSRIKAAYQDNGTDRSNNFYGWVASAN